MTIMIMIIPSFSEAALRTVRMWGVAENHLALNADHLCHLATAIPKNSPDSEQENTE
jgi:hypothetical protein